MYIIQFKEIIMVRENLNNRLGKYAYENFRSY